MAEVVGHAAAGGAAAEGLRELSKRELRERAAASGADPARIEEARDSDDDKGALIALILEALAESSGVLQAELETLGLRALRERAARDGADSDAIEAARDDDENPKKALVALVLKLAREKEARRMSLAGLSVRELRTKAVADGFPPELVEDARDADNPKAELVQLLLQPCSAVVSSSPVRRLGLPPAQVAPTPTPRPCETRAFLESLELGQYTDSLLAEGYEKVSFLLEATDDALSDAATKAKMKPPHEKRFLREVNKRKADEVPHGPASSFTSCLDREYCQKEIRWARQYNKTIIVVFEHESHRPGYFDYSRARQKYTDAEWAPILQLSGIPFQRDKFQRKAMIENIFAFATGADATGASSLALNAPGKWNFFISHHQARGGDLAFALWMLFHSAGKEAWYDQEMLVKDESAMEEGVKHSDYFILVLTADPYDELKDLEGRPACMHCGEAPQQDSFEFCSRRCAKEASTQQKLQEFMKLKKESVPLERQLSRTKSEAFLSLKLCDASSVTYTIAQHLLKTTWAKTEKYEVDKIVDVQEITNPQLQQRYEAYKARLPGDGNELQLFHGCSSTAMHSIAVQGFLKQYVNTEAWQRFGRGFYFAKNASKAHEYPLDTIEKLDKGVHTRSLLLCKVAQGRVFDAAADMKDLDDAPPEHHSVLGRASSAGLNFDELVVYSEAAILPFAVIKYTYTKKTEPLKSLLCAHCNKKEAQRGFRFCGQHCLAQFREIEGQVAAFAYATAEPGMCCFCATQEVKGTSHYCGETCEHTAKFHGWENGKPPTVCPAGKCPWCFRTGTKKDVATETDKQGKLKRFDYCGNTCRHAATKAGWVRGAPPRRRSEVKPEPDFATGLPQGDTEGMNQRRPPKLTGAPPMDTAAASPPKGGSSMTLLHHDRTPHDDDLPIEPQPEPRSDTFESGNGVREWLAQEDLEVCAGPLEDQGYDDVTLFDEEAFNGKELDDLMATLQGTAEDALLVRLRDAILRRQRREQAPVVTRPNPSPAGGRHPGKAALPPPAPAPAPREQLAAALFDDGGGGGGGGDFPSGKAPAPAPAPAASPPTTKDLDCTDV